MARRNWFMRKNGGQTTGLVILGIGLAIPTITFVKLIVQFLIAGAVCDSDCTNRGWEGVLAAWAAIPFLFVGGLVLAIATAFAKPQN